MTTLHLPAWLGGHHGAWTAQVPQPGVLPGRLPRPSYWPVNAWQNLYVLGLAYPGPSWGLGHLEVSRTRNINTEETKLLLHSAHASSALRRRQYGGQDSGTSGHQRPTPSAASPMLLPHVALVSNVWAHPQPLRAGLGPPGGPHRVSSSDLTSREQQGGRGGVRHRQAPRPGSARRWFSRAPSPEGPRGMRTGMQV